MADVATAVDTPTLSPSEQAILESAHPQPMTEAPKADDRPTPPHPLEEKRSYSRQHGRRAAATPDDVPVIRNLAALVKDLTPSNEADAPRVKELKAKVRAALELDPPAAKDEPKPEPVKIAPPAAPPPPVPGAFPDPEPQFADFMDKSADPYAAHLRALTAWDRKREAFESAQAQATTAQQAHHQAQTARFEQAKSEYWERVKTAKAEKYQDWDAVTTGKPVTPLVNAALFLLPNGEDATYFLAKNPDLLHELNLQSLSLPPTDISITLLHNRLSSRMAAGTTGAAPARPVLVAPRPPTPVKTGPMRASVESPPGDDDDLSAHRAAYGVGGSRRRR
jgi:hypothetical protein